MFNKLLIANRGEISCRIIKTARQMGVKTVAIYSDADANALHVQLADEALHVGGAASKDSYLKADHIVALAKEVGADAIHPGYGFLSENPHFAKACDANNIAFVGPPVGAIEAMGSKSTAKKIMEDAGVPLVPGYHGDDQSPALLKQHADAMGYPVLLKAAAGGGGKGMRQVWQESEFDDALAAAKREAEAGFGDSHMLVEKYLTQPRHVEIQVFCDQHGNGVYLFERDCSVQRRHQKVIEEAPAPGMTESLRDAMGTAALQAAKAINYVGAGTVEFLLDIDGSFYFMEMNTRLQVEHPVTEMITGLDLVSWQLKVANGEPLPLTQDALQINGHAFEARVYAEDPDNEFLPATGVLRFLQPPEESRHVRVDTGVVQGDEVSVYYDPMIAKLIVWDEDRDKALRRMSNALREYRIKGLTTNLNFLYNLVNVDAFQKADLDTGFIEKHHQQIFAEDQQDIAQQLPLMALYILLHSQSSPNQDHNADCHSPWNAKNAWRANEQHTQLLSITVAGEDHDVVVSQNSMTNDNSYELRIAEQSYQVSGVLSGEQLTANVNGHRQRVTVAIDDQGYSIYGQHSALQFEHNKPDMGFADGADEQASFAAPMNGTVVALLVEAGEKVSKDQPLMIMEAMKMEHSLKAPADGEVSEFFYQPGDLVNGGAELLSFTAAEQE